MHNLKIKIGCTPAELLKTQRLRYEVFNLEMGAGLKNAEASGLDQDEFDDICEHLIIIDTKKDDMVVGTYRLLLDSVAQKHNGLYSEKIFDISQLREKKDGVLLEVGRSCIHKEYRKRNNLNVLWYAIAQFVKERQVRYIFGCVSLFTKDPEEISRVYAMLKKLDFVVDTGVRPVDENHTIPLDENIRVDDPQELFKQLPPLFQKYLDLGAKVYGPPAANIDFGTTEFFIVLDIMNMNPVFKRRLLGNYSPPQTPNPTKEHALV